MNWTLEPLEDEMEMRVVMTGGVPHLVRMGREQQAMDLRARVDARSVPVAPAGWARAVLVAPSRGGAL